MAWVGLKFAFLVVQMLTISFSGAYTGSLDSKAGTTALSIVGFVLVFSPTAQLLFGIMMIFYRNPQYVL